MENYKGIIINQCNCCHCNGDQESNESNNTTNAGTNPVGTIIYAHILQPGYVKANGQLISREEYPGLYKYASDNQLLLSETDWANEMQGLFAEGDGGKTFRVPDLRGQFLRSMDDGAGFDADRVLGSKQGHASVQHQHEVPVSLGTVAATIHMDSWEYGTGELKSRYANVAGNTSTAESVRVALSGNVCKENGESRPKNIALIAQIKY